MSQDVDDVEGGVSITRRDIISEISLTIFFFTVTFIIDILWVKSSSYAGLAPWKIFFLGSLVIYLVIGVGGSILAAVISYFFKPLASSAGALIWALYFGLLLGLYVNEKVLNKRFSLTDISTLLPTIVAVLLPMGLVILLWRVVSKRKSGIHPNRLTYIIPAMVAVLAGVPLTYYFSNTSVAPWPDAGTLKQTPNVILITLDTLRADHTGIYGYEKPTTPNLDALAKESVVFDEAFTPIPLTNPAHATIHTGNYPQDHLVLTNYSGFYGEPVLKQDGTAYENIAIGNVLRGYGYESFSAVSAIHLGNDFGWGDFCDSLNQYLPPFGASLLRNTYQLAPLRIISKAFYHPNYVRKSDDVVDAFLEWESNREPQKPFFSWLHMFDVHVPYTPRPEDLSLFDTGYDGFLKCSSKDVDRYNKEKDALVKDGLDLDRYVEYVRACYDAELRFMDSQIGRLVEELKARDIFDGSLIIICADHGEGIGEHGFIGHSSVLFDYETHVPLIIKLPGGGHPGERVGEAVTLCDIAPTIYDILGCGIRVGMDGVSLLPLINGTAPSNAAGWPVPGMIFLKSHSMRWADRMVVRSIDQDSKEIAWSYYDLVSDPEGFNDLYSTEGVLPEKYKEALLKWIDRTGADFATLAGKAQGKKILDQWIIDELKANGYLN